MPKAMWNGATLAEAPEQAVERVEGNVYFPADAVRLEYLKPSETHTICGWKGTASYYDVVVEGGYAFLADYTSGLRILDVSDPAAPTLASTIDTRSAAGVGIRRHDCGL